MASAMAVITAMALSVSVAVLMERMLFGLFLRFMIAAPRVMARSTSPQPLSASELRKLDM